MPDLVRYEAAKVAIAAAVAVDEVMEIRDQATALRACARVAKDKQMEVDASEIRIRAERRLGEMIREQKQTVGLNEGAAAGGHKDGPRGPYTEPRDKRPTLAQVGIDKKLSSRSQQIASIPEDQFEETLAQHREEQQAVTTRTMERLAKQGDAQQRHAPPANDPQVRQFASMAISQLQRIALDAPNAKAELSRVSNWIAKRIEDIP